MNKLIVFGAIISIVSTGAMSYGSSVQPERLPAASLSLNSNLNFSADTATNKKKKKKKTAPKKMATLKPATTKPLAALAPHSPVRPMQPAILTPVQLAAKRMTAQPMVQKPSVLNSKNMYAQNTIPAPTSATDGGATTFKGVSLPSSAVIKTNVKVPEESTQKNPFSFTYKTINAENIDALEAPTDGKKDHEVQAWDRFYFTYNFNNDISASLMPQLFHTWFGDPDRSQDTTNQFTKNSSLTQNYSAYLGDTELTLKDAKILNFSPTTPLALTVGWFFPTSQTAQLADKVGTLRTRAAVSHSWGIFDFEAAETVYYDFQGSQTSTVLDSSGNRKRNEQYQVWSMLDGTLNFTKHWYFDLAAGFENVGLYPDEGNPNNIRPGVLNDYIIIDPEFGYNFNSHFTLAVGFWEQYDMRSAAEIGKDSSGNPITVASYTPFAAWNGNAQVYLFSKITF